MYQLWHSVPGDDRVSNILPLYFSACPNIAIKFGMKFFKILFAIPLILGLTTMAQPARAVEPGLTPSDVFGLWSDINKVVLDYGTEHLADKAVLAKFRDLQPVKYKDKEPSDVLIIVKEFEALATPLLIKHQNLDKSKRFEDQLVFLIRHNATGITPSIVFMRSSNILVAMAYSLIADQGSKRLVSPYFVEQKFKGKTPSDVYALVSLAAQRLQLVLDANARLSGGQAK